MNQPEELRRSEPPTLVSGLTTCIVGGGNSAHVLIPFLTEAGHNVNIYTRRPKEWNTTVVCEVTDGATGKVDTIHRGRVHQASTDPADVIPDADVIILCMPVHQYRPALDRLAPYLNRDKDVFVGTIFGQAGFNWMVHAMEKEHDFKNVVCFAIGQIPWICRTLEYGNRCAWYGGKKVNTIAVSPFEKFHKLDRIFLQDISIRPLGIGTFHQACSFVSLTLSTDNQIIHPARCYGLWKRDGGKWSNANAVPFFYKDFDQQSADFVGRLDQDYSTVRNAIKERFPNRDFKYMLNYLDLEKLNHGTCRVDILDSFRDSKQLAAIKTPTVENSDGSHSLNTECRFFTDDIPFGLLVAKAIAEMLGGVPTPFIDEIINWAQTLRGEQWLTPDKKINLDFSLKGKYSSGIPQAYGFTKIEDLLD